MKRLLPDKWTKQFPAGNNANRNKKTKKNSRIGLWKCICRSIYLSFQRNTSLRKPSNKKGFIIRLRSVIQPSPAPKSPSINTPSCHAPILHVIIFNYRSVCRPLKTNGKLFSRDVFNLIFCIRTKLS